MTKNDQAGTAPGAEAPHWTSRWRASYQRGEWLLLSGPTSLVVMQPAAPQWSELINAIWEDLLASASIGDLAGRLAEFRLDGMPDFAALFWERDQMRSLVRGRVRLVDPDTGRSIAGGEGVQTWTEVGLGELQQVEIQAGDQTDDERLELPLVIGAVNASRVVLDCSDEMQIRSPQGTFVGDGGALDRLDAPADPTPADPSSAEPAGPGPAGVAMSGAAMGAAATGGASSGGPQPDGSPGRPAHAADDDAGERGETAVDQSPVPATGQQDQDSSDADSRSGDSDQDKPSQEGSGQDKLGQDESGQDEPGQDKSGQDESSGQSSAGSGSDIGGPKSSGPQHASPSSDSGPAGGPQQSSGHRPDDEDGYTMVAESLPGVPSTQGPSGAPPNRSVLGLLHPSSGGTIEVDRPVVIGRSPVASRVRSDELPRLLTVPSPSHDISRTHVQIAPENGRLVVTDLNSTNGTILVLPDGRRTDLSPGAGVPVEFGSVIDLGDGVTIAVDRG